MIKKLILFQLVLLFLFFLCTKKSNMPDFVIYSYRDKEKYHVSDIIKTKSMVIWMPMNNCGICIHNIVNAINKLDVANTIIILTSNSNPSHYNWILLNLKKIESNKNALFFEIAEDEGIKNYKFFENHNKIQAFVADTNLNIYNKMLLMGDEKNIKIILEYLDNM